MFGLLLWQLLANYDLVDMLLERTPDYDEALAEVHGLTLLL